MENYPAFHYFIYLEISHLFMGGDIKLTVPSNILFRFVKEHKRLYLAEYCQKNTTFLQQGILLGQICFEI